MVRNLVVLALISLPVAVSAQEIYKREGTFEASATIAPSVMLNRAENNYYIMGYLVYHMSPKLSFRGESFVFVDGEEDVPFYNSCIRTHFGAFYHWQHKNWDKYIGFSPGVAVQKKNPYSDGLQPLVAIEPKTAVAPSFAITAGTSFYVWKCFNFFANLTYVNSKLGGVEDGPHQTDELILSAGLGFQINTKKIK